MEAVDEVKEIEKEMKDSHPKKAPASRDEHWKRRSGQ